MLLTLLEQPNFLILDEPTNDLDIMTLGMLEDFLLSYPGCLLIISHDRMFMDRVVDHLFVFEGEGVISDFPGNYSEWEDAQLDKEEEQTSVDPEPVQSCVATQDIMQQQVAKKKSLSNKEREEYAWLGEEIERLEIRKEAINNELGT